MFYKTNLVGELASTPSSSTDTTENNNNNADGDDDKGKKRKPEKPKTNDNNADGDDDKGKKRKPEKPKTNDNNADGDDDKGKKRKPEKPKTNDKNKKKQCRPGIQKIVRTGTPEAKKCELLDTLIRLDTDLEPACVLEKKLVSTDINVDQCRLQLSAAQIAPLFKNSVLTEKEAAEINSILGLQVKAYDFKGNEYVMELKYLSTTGFYRIKKSWGKFLDAHLLKKDEIMAVWVFRMGGDHELGMMLLNYDEKDREQRRIDEELFDEKLAADGLTSLNVYRFPRRKRFQLQIDEEED